MSKRAQQHQTAIDVFCVPPSSSHNTEHESFYAVAALRSAEMNPDPLFFPPDVPPSSILIPSLLFSLWSDTWWTVVQEVSCFQTFPSVKLYSVTKSISASLSVSFHSTTFRLLHWNSILCHMGLAFGWCQGSEDMPCWKSRIQTSSAASTLWAPSRVNTENLKFSTLRQRQELSTTARSSILGRCRRMTRHVFISNRSVL